MSTISKVFVWNWLIEYGNHLTFLEGEFQKLNLRDKRLNVRAITILKALQEKLTSCVRRLFTKNNDMRQAYDFFSNSKVDSMALFPPHQEKTIERITTEQSEYILAQDSTFLNYTTHKAKIELGRIGGTRNRCIYGLVQHSTLCITEDNVPLGLLDLQFFDYDERNTSIPSKLRAIEEKHSERWLRASKVMKERVLSPDITSTKKIVTIADREGDFFDFLQELHNNNQLYVIRAKYDRYTGEKHRHHGEKLFNIVDRQEVIGHMQVNLYDVNSKIEKLVNLSLKCASEVKLPPVWRAKGSIKETDLAIKVNVVKAYNGEYCWILLTNLPVNNEQNIKKIVKFYRCRWHIENFHKVLKTAYQAKKIYLHASRQAIENALTLVAFAACRLYWIICRGRQEKEATSNSSIR